jgi:hypothetical protein
MKKVAFCAAIALTLLFARSSVAADDSYALSKTDARLTVGSKGKVSVTISAQKGWHINAEAPLTLKILAPTGVTVDKTKLSRGDLALSNETTARFDIGLTASEPGKIAIEAEAGFVLCQEDSCRPIKEKLTLAVDASSPAAATSKRLTKKN